MNGRTPPQFGTSGLRGLVSDLTPDLIAGYTDAFLSACRQGDTVFVGRDLRPSSSRIAEDVIAAVRRAGLRAVDCGRVPTPALALAAMHAGAAAIMVTGSHIPADRNGLKFYLPAGEISKADEARIASAYAAGTRPAESGKGMLETFDADAPYVARYIRAFGSDALAGLRIGVWQHSSVAREVMLRVVEKLGGTAVPLAPSDTFIPVDTEAVDGETRATLAAWCRAHALDAVISTDGDADRPLLADDTGTLIPGDIMGALTARALGADQICTPVSSNSMLGQMPEFRRVVLTRIGSPFVIAAIEEALRADPAVRVVGFEANGGFLLGFAASGPAGPLAPLMTRDSLLPLVAPLAAAKAAGGTLADLLATLPARATVADRLTDVPTERSAALLHSLTTNPAARADFLAPAGTEQAIDLTDGLRITLTDGRILHLRPSGNAPEFRIYTEAQTQGAAQALLRVILPRLRSQVGEAIPSGGG